MNKFGIGDELECRAEIIRQCAADAIDARPFGLNDDGQSDRLVRTAVENEKSQFRRQAAEVRAIKIVEAFDIVDLLQKAVGAQLITEKLGRHALEFHFLLDCAE